MTPDERKGWERWAVNTMKKLIGDTEKSVAELEAAYKVVHGSDAKINADDHPRYLELLSSLQAYRRDVADAEGRIARGEPLQGSPGFETDD